MVTQSGNAITFEADVQFTGQSNAAIEHRIVQGIEGEWSGSFGGYDVKTDLQVVSSGGDFTVNIDPTITRAYADCVGCNRFHVAPGDSGWTAAHEFGHVMGLVDRYTDVPGVGSVPRAGWEGNIMAQYGGRVWRRDIDFLLGR